MLDPSARRALWAAASRSATGGRTRTPARTFAVARRPPRGRRARARAPAGAAARGARPALAAAGRLRAALAPAAASSSPSCGRRFPVFVRFGGIDYDDDEDAIEKLDEFVRAAQRILSRLRRQRPPADPRRQGRLPLRRLRVAVRARGRRRARRRRRARAARPRADDRRAGHPDRDHARPAAERHVRPRDAAHLRLPRRRRQPLRAADVDGAAGADLRVGAVRRRPPARRSSGSGSRPEGQGQGEPGRGLRRSPARSERARAARRRYELRLVGRGTSSRPSSGGSPKRWRARDASSASPPRPGMGKSRLVAEFVRDARRDGRTRSPSASASRSGPGRHYFVWREIWRRAPRARRRPAARASSRHARAEAGRDRPGARRRARRCSTRSSGCRSPTPS